MEPESKTHLRFERSDTTYYICAETWRELIEFASEKGWRSRHTPACYWADIGLEVTTDDAHGLARIFESIGDDLVLNSKQYPFEDSSQLVAELGDLLIFCSSGAFRIC